MTRVFLGDIELGTLHRQHIRQETPVSCGHIAHTGLSHSYTAEPCWNQASIAGDNDRETFALQPLGSVAVSHRPHIGQKIHLSCGRPWLGSVLGSPAQRPAAGQDATASDAKSVRMTGVLLGDIELSTSHRSHIGQEIPVSCGRPMLDDGSTTVSGCAQLDAATVTSRPACAMRPHDKGDSRRCLDLRVA